MLLLNSAHTYHQKHSLLHFYNDEDKIILVQNILILSEIYTLLRSTHNEVPICKVKLSFLTTIHHYTTAVLNTVEFSAKDE